MKRLLAVMLLLPVACAQGAKSDTDGWIDLMPAKDLKGWKRVPIDPLAAKPVWTVSEDGKILLCDGVKAKEILLHGQERGDGIFHVEWRWRKSEEEKPIYNSGVYVRTSMDGKIWVQAQIARADKPPVVGDLFGVVPLPGKAAPERVEALQKEANREKPMGEWNTYEITCKGTSIALWVNGAVTSTWPDCPVARGHIGLQAEFAFLEFRNLKFKPLP